MTNRTHPPTTPNEVLQDLATIAAAVEGGSSDPLAVVSALPPMPTEPEHLPTNIDVDHEVYALRMAGYTAYQVSGQMTTRTHQRWSVEDVESACRRVGVMNATRNPEQLAFAAQLDLDRIDAMIRVLWPQAEAGNHQAIDRIERMMRRRAEMLGTDAPDVKIALTLGADNPVDLGALSGDELRQYRDLQRKATTAAKTKVVRGRVVGPTT